MNIDFQAFDYLHLLGNSATRPIRPPSGALAALLLVAHTSARPWSPLPARPMTTQLGRVQLPFPG
ncbi:MAG: hypothetical protein LBE78_01565 [Burkholderiaceae bacterium]|nr:hypothetical protein [Burkholderiaceae bacterium]